MDEICRIESESFPEPYPRDLFERLLGEGKVTFLAATDLRGQVVGYCVGVLEVERGHLISIAVEATNRRTGIALRLLDKLIGGMENDGAEELWLEVRPDNIAAITLYEKLGFVKSGFAPNYYRDGTDALIMRMPFPRGEASGR